MKIRWPFVTQKRDDDMSQEMAFHIESTARELVRGGMSERDARLEARRRFGSVLKLERHGGGHGHRAPQAGDDQLCRLSRRAADRWQCLGYGDQRHLHQRPADRRRLRRHSRRRLVTLTATALLRCSRSTAWTGTASTSATNPLALASPNADIACTATSGSVPVRTAVVRRQHSPRCAPARGRALVGAEVALRDDPVELVDQRVVEAVRVQQRDRLVVDTEQPPGEDLEQLLEGADAAGQRHEGVRESAIRALRSCIESTSTSRVSPGGHLAREKVARDHADHVATGGERASASSPIIPTCAPP